MKAANRSVSATDAGVSMIEVMIAVGAMSLLTLGAASLVQQQGRMQRGVRAMADLNELSALLSLYLRAPRTCTQYLNAMLEHRLTPPFPSGYGAVPKLAPFFPKIPGLHWPPGTECNRTSLACPDAAPTFGVNYLHDSYISESVTVDSWTSGSKSYRLHVAQAVMELDRTQTNRNDATPQRGPAAMGSSRREIAVPIRYLTYQRSPTDPEEITACGVDGIRGKLAQIRDLRMAMWLNLRYQPGVELHTGFVAADFPTAVELKREIEDSLQLQPDEVATLVSAPVPFTVPSEVGLQFGSLSLKETMIYGNLRVDHLKVAERSTPIPPLDIGTSRTYRIDLVLETSIIGGAIQPEERIPIRVVTDRSVPSLEKIVLFSTDGTSSPLAYSQVFYRREIASAYGPADGQNINVDADGTSTFDRLRCDAPEDRLISCNGKAQRNNVAGRRALYQLYPVYQVFPNFDYCHCWGTDPNENGRVSRSCADIAIVCMKGAKSATNPNP